MGGDRGIIGCRSRKLEHAGRGIPFILVVVRGDTKVTDRGNCGG